MDQSLLQPPDREFLDFKNGTSNIPGKNIVPIKEPRKLVDKPYVPVPTDAKRTAGIVSQGEVEDYGEGPLTGPTMNPQPAIQAQPVPLPPPPSGSSGQLQPQPVSQASDADLIEARLAKIFGQPPAQEDRIAALEARFTDVLGRLESRLSSGTTTPQAAYQPSGYGQEPPAQGDFVSRSELQRTLTDFTNRLGEVAGAQTRQIYSRIEAEKDFPDVFGSPALKAAADRLVATDPMFSRDPQGPYKAAMMVRGAAGLRGLSPVGGQALSAEVKQALAGLGPTVAEGSGQVEDRVTRYQRALSKFKVTGKVDDYLEARRVQNEAG